MIKFAHLADCHLGSWSHPKMRDLNEQSFVYAVDYCIAEKVDFVLIAGDLFNTAFPALDSLRIAVEKIKHLNDNNIPVYIIPGSHDSSASGKTIIDVLESAGIVTNVTRGTLDTGKLKLQFTIDKKTGTKITGMLGKRGGLEKDYYHQLSNEHLEQADGYKIFLFHSALNELKPESFAGMDAMSASLLPKHFDYYAGGHVHIVHTTNLEERKNIVYPGPVFPNSFSELEKLKHGSFCLVENNHIRHVIVELHPTQSFFLNATGKTPSEIEIELMQQVSSTKLTNALVTLRLTGTLREGKTSDINFKKITTFIEEQGAYFVLKNTANLISPEFQQVSLSLGGVDDVEQKLVREHAVQKQLITLEKDISLIHTFLKELSTEKNEAEKVADFEKRIIMSADALVLTLLHST